MKKKKGKNAIITDKGKIEVILQKSCKCTHDHGGSQGNSIPRSEEAQSYHRSGWPFTQKLRRLMKDNPTLPVVVFPQLSKTNDAIDCAVAYVYDQEGERFLEKVISVHSVQRDPPKTENDDSDLPF